MAEENLQITTFEQLATLLSQVAQNNTNLSLTYYNMFYNSTPQDITLSLYVDGTLQSFTVPNRAKDFNYIKNGSGSPEGSVIANIGTTYQDTLNGKLYIKVTGTDSQGWVEIANNEMLQYGVDNPEGVITAPSGALYVNTSTAILYIKTTSTGSTGWISISNNATTWAKIDLSNINVGSSDTAGNKIRSAILGGASTIAGTDLTANRALVSNGSGKVSVSDTTATELAAIHGLTATATELNKLSGLATTKTELGYVNGVTSNIQTQLNGKLSASSLKTINNTSLIGSGDMSLQPTLVSGTNIKTINSNSVLGSGNMSVSTLLTGTVIWWTLSSPPDGYIICDGSSLLRTQYATLFAVLGTTYGAADSTHFYIPDLLNGRFIEGSSTVGSYKEAGLPNITGWVSSVHGNGCSGCFSWGPGSQYSYDGAAYYGLTVNFSANGSNSIYGNSSTVQPKSLTLLPCIKY